MAQVVISNVKHEVFGNCVKLQNSEIELLVTVDFGPRLIHFSRIGKENMMFQDLDKKTLGEKFDIYGGEQLRLYGGHRLWVSPEVMPRCYYPDSKPVICNPVENGMEFVSPIEEFNHIQKSITITLSPDRPSCMLSHAVENHGAWDIELAPWCITMLDKGARGIVPMPHQKTGFLPNRQIVLWDYASMNDERVYWGKDFVSLEQKPSVKHPFKFGLLNEDGWTAIFNKEQLFVKFFEPVSDATYPDSGCNFESYTNGEMIECETLGELVILPPDEYVTFVEEWELYDESNVPTNEQEIKTILSKYINL